jgi:plasmid stability protein
MHMSKMIQIRNVPDALHCRLKALAALAGRSLSDYLTDELRRTAERPTLEELRHRIAAREPVRLKESAAEAIRAEREQHENARQQPARRRGSG